MSSEVRTFVLTDLVGSTMLWDEEPEEMRRALQRHDSLVAHVVTTRGGQLIQSKGEGDSTFSVFVDPVAAVAAAHGLVVAVRDALWPTSKPLAVRVGVHVGPADRRGSNWFGSTVNRAARLRAVAPPGAVFLSGATAEMVRTNAPPGASIVFVGRRRLRGLREQEPIWAVVPTGCPVPMFSADVPDEPGSLPNWLDSFVGRTATVAEVSALLDTERFVDITGPGGIGKTRVAVEAVRAWMRRTGGPCWFVDLSAVANSTWVTDALVRTLDLARSAEELERSLSGLIHDRPAVIVLDNTEHVRSAAAELARRVLSVCPTLRVLATGRTPLAPIPFS